jgi:hypothetical protein
MSEPASRSVASETAFLQITISRALCIWWAYFWRHMLYGGTALFVVAFLEGLAGLGGQHLLLSLCAVLVMAAASMFVLAIVLHKQFRQFSIRLVVSPHLSTTASVSGE